ncbi:hypothetical protein [Paenibacillus mucilaginosus]|uniref:Uncharacterized protein n=1 Tax=Paenibacillus mucilaginosus (strain KNP414) TaxID=1036673 RepID=F8FMJ3_PAEMK|nr:hypothetical protein [Paenibacillus mucilaginosus]AEI40076.1 hypothetical protein KNP414_01512 [Paenibacillus mucilaginosus KNP414]MCG7215682.1 hypothetical protein [Paenibacillus mucilaginosus]WDM29314.1 hypothetical protein KCX80_09220 [Paenibacillus mucilaginosus]
MAGIKHAECKRIVERSDQLCADVEVQLEGEKQAFIALFTDAGDEDYRLEMILKNDADPAIDWYDNDLHAAYEDVTEELFGGTQGGSGWSSKEEFKEAVLAYPGVRSQIRTQLDAAEAQKLQEIQA